MTPRPCKKNRDDCRRIRLQIILGFSQLKTIIDTSKKEPNIDLKKDLVKWVKYMNDLHKLGIELLKPFPQGVGKGKSAVKLANITTYQGITEKDIKEALKG